MSEVWVWEYEGEEDKDSRLLAWEFFSSEAAAKAAAQDHADMNANLAKEPTAPLTWMVPFPATTWPFSKAVVNGKYLGFNEVHTYFVAQLRFVR